MKEQPFLQAEWRYLAMLNYEIDPDRLAPRLPAGLELDFFEGRTFVTVVGFLFQNSRILGLPIPYHRNFEEVNLRYYVRRKEAGAWRRGVIFIKEIVPRRAVTAVARRLYGENYVTRAMRHEIDLDGGRLRPDGWVSYAFREEGRWNRLAVQTEGSAAHPAPGSMGHFIIEHYRGYSTNGQKEAIGYRVEHPPWRLWRAADARLTIDAAAIYGPAFADVLAAEPDSAFVAEGSPVKVYRGRSLGEK